MDHLSANEIVVTGDRPTGALHLGHYVGSLLNRVSLQHTHSMYVLIADTQVLNNDVSKARQVKHNVIEVLRDYLSVGLDPDKVCIFLQSSIPELFELSAYLANFVTVPQVSRIPTIKHENSVYNNVTSLGFLNYPVSQTADILLFDGTLVPVGIDQVPILDFSNDLLNRFNLAVKNKVFKSIKPLLSDTSKLVGTDGSNKMSKSLGNAILLGDDSATLKQKVFSMYTDSNHLKITDPGKIEGNVVFQFLDVFHSDQEELSELKFKYQKGGIGDVFLKSMLFKDLNTVLDPIRERRNSYTDTRLLEILHSGSVKAKSVAAYRMSLIKDYLFF